MEDPPPARPFGGKAKESAPPLVLPPVDYYEREMRNRTLGDAGEELAVEYERARLRRADREALADRVERVSVTEGPAAGYDIHSYEAAGTDRYIEVKTTTSGRYSPFYVTTHELAFAQGHADRFHLYRFHSFRTRRRVFSLAGDIARHCNLEPLQFRATLGLRTVLLPGA